MSGFKNEILRANGIVLSAADAADQRITNLLQNLEAGSTMITNFAGDPEGSLQGNVGSLCLDRTNGILYIKVTGTGNTGWEVVTSNLTITGDSGGPLSPTAGNWNILGSVVANATNAKPVSVEGAVSTETIEVQLATTLTADAGDTNDVGLSSYYDMSFGTNTNGLVYSKANQTVPGVVNLGITYSGGTFTVNGQEGTALSATNPAYVTLQSKTAGQLVTVPVTANQTFTDGSSGSIDNMRWGVTTGVNWANDAPFYLYAVLNDAEDTIAFMISRIPNRVTAPAATGIGQSGAVVNTGQGDMFSLLSITTGDYNGNPVLCLGSFRMQFAGATDSWTVQSLSTSDGIGKFNEQTIFTYPTGQNGNASGSYFAANGGTAPIWTSQTALYSIDKIGNINFIWDVPTAGTISTAGAGAVNLLMNFPLAFDLPQRQSIINFLNSGGTTTLNGRWLNPSTGATSNLAIKVWSSTVDNLTLQNLDCTVNAKFIKSFYGYKAYISP